MILPRTMPQPSPSLLLCAVTTLILILLGASLSSALLLHAPPRTTTTTTTTPRGHLVDQVVLGPCFPRLRPPSVASVPPHPRPPSFLLPARGTRLLATFGGEDDASTRAPRPRKSSSPLGFPSILSNLLRRSGLSALFATKGDESSSKVEPKNLIDSDRVRDAMPKKGEPYWAMQEEDDHGERNNSKQQQQQAPKKKKEKEKKTPPRAKAMVEAKAGATDDPSSSSSRHHDHQSMGGINLDIDVNPEVAERVRSAVREYLTEPLLSPDIERDVPTDVIRGAVVNGLAFALLATEFGSFPAAVVSATVSGYLAITPGPVGDLVRRLGGFSARIGQSFSDLFLGGKPWEQPRRRGRSQQSAPMGVGVVGGVDYDTELERVLREAAEAERQAEAAERELARVEEESRMEELVEEEQVLAAAERAKREHIAKLEAAEEELIRLAEEKHRERVRLEEEEAGRVVEGRRREEEERIAAARAEEDRLVKAKAEREEQKRKAAEKAELDRQRREAAAKAEQERLSQLEAKRQEQKRIAAEKLEKERKEKERLAAAKAEQDRVAKLKAEEEERKRVAAEQARLEQERIEEEKRKAEEEERKRVAAEQARLEKERIEEEKAERERVKEERRIEEEARLADAKLKEEEAQRQEWEEAVRLAQQLDGVDEATVNADVVDASMAVDNEKTQWDAAHRLAKSLATGDRVSEVNAKKADVSDSAPETVVNSQEELGRLAREAVEKFEAERMAQEEVDRKVKFGKSLKRRSTRVPETNSVVVQNSGDVDWESMTVAELKGALRDRGLKVSGRKAELIERLKQTQS